MAPPKRSRPALPAMPPQMKRNLKFLGVALGGSLLLFLIIGFTLTGSNPDGNGFLIAMLLGPVGGVTAARLLHGWPRLETRDGKALVPPQYKPYLFFVITPAVTFVGYLVLGVYITPYVENPQYVPYVALAVGLVVGASVAYFLVGFPKFWEPVVKGWRAIPTERRPWLFFVAAPAFTVLFYFLLGLLLTNVEAIGDVIPLETQPLLALPLAVAAACALAYRLLGFPKPQKPVREYVPEVPGRARPLAFLVTLLVAGVPLSYLAGLALTYAPRLPGGALVPLAVVLGLSAGAGVAALAWGTPRKWRRFADYRPGLPEGARYALFLPVVVAFAIVGGAISNGVGFDLFPGILLGAAIGILVGLQVSGALAAMRRARGTRRTILPELPDMVKPLVLFPTWFLLGWLVFVTLAYAMPELVWYHLWIAIAVGGAVSVYLVEEPTFLDWRERRREARRRAAALKARRKEALATLAQREPAKKKA